jgi:hypothetical protein
VQLVVLLLATGFLIWDMSERGFHWSIDHYGLVLLSLQCLYFLLEKLSRWPRPVKIMLGVLNVSLLVFDVLWLLCVMGTGDSHLLFSLDKGVSGS